MVVADVADADTGTLLLVVVMAAVLQLGLLYSFSLIFLLDASQSTFINMKLMTVNMQQGSSFIITECTQKLKLKMIISLEFYFK